MNRNDQPTRPRSLGGRAIIPGSHVDSAMHHPENDVAYEWQVGDIILDLYEVKDIFKTGGMGLVYRVHHRDWHIDLAVKSPRQEFFTTNAHRESFIRECETWVNLQLHMHVVSCYYVRVLGGIPRVFAEYVEGGSLSHWIRDGRLYEGSRKESIERILDVTIQFAWGLQYAHEQGLIHQDVKPANLMMMPDGTAKVGDFGLARARAMIGERRQAVSDQNSLVSVGGMTPAYCSPEQAEQKPLTYKTDIWSWGVSVLEMFMGGVSWMTGQVVGEALAGYLETRAGDSPIPMMPTRLADLLKQCFQISLKQRPMNMNQVALTLQEIYEQEVGRAYWRPVPKPAETLADSLNNRAVSLMDLGKQQEAGRIWQQALQVEPEHLQATFNSGYQAWQAGKLDDLQYLKNLRNLSLRHGMDSGYWHSLSLIHCERSDQDQAAQALENIRSIDTLHPARVECTSSLRNIHMHRLPSMPQCAALSRDGRFIACGLADYSMIIVDSMPPFNTHAVVSHVEPINALHFAMDGKHLITGSFSDRLTIWALSPVHAIKILIRDKSKSPNDEMTTIVGHPDGYHVAAAGKAVGVSTRDHQPISLWDFKAEVLDNTLAGHECAVVAYSRPVTGSSAKKQKLYGGGISCLAIFADGEYLISGGSSGKIKLWHLPTGKCISTLSDSSREVFTIALSPDSRYFASGGSDGLVKLWDLQSLSCVATLQGHAGEVRSIVYSYHGEYLLSGGDDGTIRLWDLRKLICKRTFQEHSSPVTTVGIIPNSSAFFSLSKDLTLRIWEFNSCEHKHYSFLIVKPRNYSALTDEQTLANNLIHAADEHLRNGFPQRAYDHLRDAQKLPGYAAFPAIMDRLYLCARNAKPVSLNNRWLALTLKESDSPVNSFALSPDGRSVLSATGDHKIHVWDALSGKHIKSFPGHADGILVVSFATDGQQAFSGSKNFSLSHKEGDSVLKYWDISSNSCIHDFDGFDGGISSIAVHPLSNTIVTAGWQRLPKIDGNVLRVWDVRQKSLIKLLEGHSDIIEKVVFAPKGSFIASGGRDKKIMVWDAVAMRPVATLEGHEGTIYSISFSPDERFLLSCGTDETVRLWDLGTSQCIRIFQGHKETLRAVAFSPDGRFALSGGDDLTIRLWSIDSGNCLGTFDGHKDGVTGVSFSADCRYIWSCSYDGSIQQWELDWLHRFET